MKSASQPNPAPSGVLGTVAKLIRLTEKEDVEWSHWQHPTNNVTARRNLAKYLKKGCPNDNGGVTTNQLLEGHELARLILGYSYITPEEVAIAYGISYTDEQLDYFADTMPDMQTILWLRTNEYMLIAGPPAELNLLQFRELDSQLFCSKTEGWYAESKEEFAKDDVVNAGQWLAIRKKAVPNSFSKTWKEQQSLITEVEYVPNASEVSYAVVTFFKICGTYLLRGKKHVRTSSVSSDGDHINVGYFYDDGFTVNHYWDDCRCDVIGISSARLLRNES